MPRASRAWLPFYEAARGPSTLGYDADDGTAASIFIRSAGAAFANVCSERYPRRHHFEKLTDITLRCPLSSLSEINVFSCGPVFVELALQKALELNQLFGQQPEKGEQRQWDVVCAIRADDVAGGLVWYKMTTAKTGRAIEASATALEFCAEFAGSRGCF
ncbi:hypothetical protein NDU88_001643 [Pleurodeles waltl]|uniref:Uncharacterized protein n=1 Tax=Pleurodeles waltl TaxID=8319 RepID=A0AAV7T029_PLEWA|nr:hypothetical protein NDU88_001643 [Pleurodeles waltl]